MGKTPRLVKMVASLTALVLLGNGCGKDAGSLQAKNARLFQAAEPPVKAQWATASAAIKTNGYVPAMVSLMQLQKATLTPDQLQAVNETVSAVSDQMYEAANKGDAHAKEAIAALRQLRSR